METIGAARIGNGGKLHPATKTESGHIFFLCSCGNTQNGHAAHRAQFFADAARTCGKRTAPIADWAPVEDPDAWKRADDALIAAHRAKRAGAAQAA